MSVCVAPCISRTPKLPVKITGDDSNSWLICPSRNEVRGSAIGDVPSAVSLGKGNRDGTPARGLSDQGNIGKTIAIEVTGDDSNSWLICPSRNKVRGSAVGDVPSAISLGKGNRDGTPPRGLPDQGNIGETIAIEVTGDDSNSWLICPSRNKVRGSSIGDVPSAISIGKGNGDGAPARSLPDQGKIGETIAIEVTGDDSNSWLICPSRNKVRGSSIGDVPSAISLGKGNRDGTPPRGLPDEGNIGETIAIEVTGDDSNSWLICPSRNKVRGSSIGDVPSAISIGKGNGDGAPARSLPDEGNIGETIAIEVTGYNSNSWLICPSRNEVRGSSIGDVPSAISLGKGNRDGTPPRSLPDEGNIGETIAIEVTGCNSNSWLICPSRNEVRGSSIGDVPSCHLPWKRRPGWYSSQESAGPERYHSPVQSKV